MKRSTIIILAVLFIFILMISSVFGSYNNLVTRNESVDTSWARVESQYQRRFDLIPNLVAATKGPMAQEREVFGAIAQARTQYAGSTPNSNERVEATQRYESALSRLLIVMENYPELKSIESVRVLTDELAGTENRVLVARDRYNEEVQIYNVMIKRFPTIIIASMMNFDAKEFFKSEEGTQKAPTVDMTIQ